MNEKFYSNSEIKNCWFLKLIPNVIKRSLKPSKNIKSQSQNLLINARYKCNVCFTLNLSVIFYILFVMAKIVFTFLFFLYLSLQFNFCVLFQKTYLMRTIIFLNLPVEFGINLYISFFLSFFFTLILIIYFCSVFTETYFECNYKWKYKIAIENIGHRIKIKKFK